MKITEQDKNRTVEQWKQFVRARVVISVICGTLVGAGFMVAVLAWAYFRVG